MTHNNKTRYNYAGNGRNGSNNKGKKYNNYSLPPPVDPECMQRCTKFKNWFNENYQQLKLNLIEKGKYDDDCMVNTFLKIYRALEYGTIVNDYRTYFATSYFTNIFNQEVTTTKYNNKVEYIENESLYDSIDDGDNEAQYAAKDALINEIGEWLNDNVDDIIERDLFIMYINLKKTDKMTYQKLSKTTGVEINKVAECISRIKKQIQIEFKNKRLKTL